MYCCQIFFFWEGGGGDFSGLPPLHMKPCWLPHSLNPRLSVLSHDLGENLQDKIWNGNARFESGSLIPGPLQNSRLFVWQNDIGTGCHGIGLYFLCRDGVKTDDIQNSAVLSANGQRRQDTHMIYVVILTPKPGFCILCMRRLISDFPRTRFVDSSCIHEGSYEPNQGRCWWRWSCLAGQSCHVHMTRAHNNGRLE